MILHLIDSDIPESKTNTHSSRPITPSQQINTTLTTAKFMKFVRKTREVKLTATRRL